MLQKIRWFIEDYALWFVGGALALGILVGALLFSGDADCSAEVQAAENAIVAEMIQAVTPVMLRAKLQMQQDKLQIRQLQAQLVEARANGSSGDAGIRENEAYGAWSDPAGEFVCFPAHGEGGWAPGR